MELIRGESCTSSLRDKWCEAGILRMILCDVMLYELHDLWCNIFISSDISTLRMSREPVDCSFSLAHGELLVELQRWSETERLVVLCGGNLWLQYVKEFSWPTALCSGVILAIALAHSEQAECNPPLSPCRQVQNSASRHVNWHWPVT